MAEAMCDKAIRDFVALEERHSSPDVAAKSLVVIRRT